MNVPAFLQEHPDEWFTKGNIATRYGAAMFYRRDVEAQIERARREQGAPIISGGEGYCWTTSYPEVVRYFGSAGRRIATQARNMRSMAAKCRDAWFKDDPPIQMDFEFEEEAKG